MKSVQLLFIHYTGKKKKKFKCVCSILDYFSYYFLYIFASIHLIEFDYYIHNFKYLNISFTVGNLN
jgi:hypothetical protein